MVFYRKYRPQTVSELDLTSVRQKITSILSSENIPHALLFAGPKGLGKTSAARIVAKAINCEQKLGSDLKKAISKQSKVISKSIEPCNKCSACISITNGSAVDVIEIDAASNRGIDEIRDLKERIKFSPSSLKTKVYIIDEVHMLTTEAFNALLKTLEEPPSHVVFILATTELGKLPPTITSRTFYIPFQKPTKEEIARSLQRVVQGEGLDIDEKVIEKVGELSDGAFRDGAKILEDLFFQSHGRKITIELLDNLYKAGPIDLAVKKITDFTLKKNTKDALAVVSDLSNINADFKTVIEKMADILHKKLLDEVFKNDSSTMFSVQKLLALLDDAYKNMKGTVIPSLPLELAIIGYGFETNAEKLASIEVQPQLASKNLIIESTFKEDKSVQPYVPHLELQNSSTAKPQKTDSDQDTFRKMLDLVNIENKILAGLLRGSHLEINGENAILKTQSRFHMEKLSENKNKEIIEHKLEKVLGSKVAIEIKN